MENTKLTGRCKKASRNTRKVLRASSPSKFCSLMTTAGCTKVDLVLFLLLFVCLFVFFCSPPVSQWYHGVMWKLPFAALHHVRWWTCSEKEQSTFAKAAKPSLFCRTINQNALSNIKCIKMNNSQHQNNKPHWVQSKTREETWQWYMLPTKQKAVLTSGLWTRF